MKVIDEVREIMENHDLEVAVKENMVIGIHKSIPVSLSVILNGLNAELSIEADEELRDILEELIESGEDISSLVDDVLSELRDIALEIQGLLEKRGFKVELNLREGENDVRDLLEEITEEYEEVLEEELGIGEEEY